MPDIPSDADQTSNLPENESSQPPLIQYGLARAVQIHVEDLRARSGEVRFELDLVEDENLLSDAENRALFRAYEQVIEDAVHRPGTKQVWVRYYPAKGSMILEVRDDGQGFALPSQWADLDRPHLEAARQEAKAGGGTLAIRSHPGGKTTVQVRFPLPVG